VLTKVVRRGVAGIDNTTGRWAERRRTTCSAQLHGGLADDAAASVRKGRARCRVSWQCTWRGLQTGGQMGGVVRRLATATTSEDERQLHHSSSRTARWVLTPRQLGGTMQSHRCLRVGQQRSSQRWMVMGGGTTRWRHGGAGAGALSISNRGKEKRGGRRVGWAGENRRREVNLT
jgi:hypothetical protein